MRHLLDNIVNVGSIHNPAALPCKMHKKKFFLCACSSLTSALLSVLVLAGVKRHFFIYIYLCKRTRFNTFTRYSFFLIACYPCSLKEQVPQLCQGKLICYEGVIHSCFSRAREPLSYAHCQIE